MCSWSKNGPWVVVVDGKAYGPYTERQAPDVAKKLRDENPTANVTHYPMQKHP